MNFENNNLLTYSVIFLVIASIINLFVYVISKMRRNNDLLQYSTTFFYIYPLILIMFLMRFIGLDKVYYIFFIFAIIIIYYLYLFLPSYQINPQADIKETFNDFIPKGVLATNDQWQTTDKNTVYYSENPTIGQHDYPGQSGPCVVDDRFDYQIGFEKKNACKKPSLPAPATADATSSSGTSSSGTSSSGTSSLVPSTPLNFPGDNTSTPCYPDDLPPASGGANFNFWCRFANQDRKYGAKKLHYGQAGDCSRQQSARAECSQLYKSQFFQYGDPNKVSVTSCLPWDTNFEMACLPNKFNKKVIGDCPPAHGRGICDIGGTPITASNQ